MFTVKHELSPTVKHWIESKVVVALGEKLERNLRDEPPEDRFFGCRRQVDIDEPKSPPGRDDERKSLSALFQLVTVSLVAWFADLIGYGVAIEGFLDDVLEGCVDELPAAPDAMLHEP